MGEEANKSPITNHQSPITRSKTWELYDSFMETLASPPPINYFDPNFADRDLLEFHNFKPERIMELLVERASSKNTTPKEFHKEINQIISLRYEAENDKDLDENSDSYTTLKALRAKYNVTESGNDLDSITFSRLGFMFPHFSIAYSLTDQVTLGPEIEAPELPSAAEFGGLIPNGRILKETVREALIILHLACLNKQDRASGLIPPFCTSQTLLKLRMQSSLLSDERRVRFLVFRGVLTKGGELSREIEEAFEYVKSSNWYCYTTGDIEWNLINWEV